MDIGSFGAVMLRIIRGCDLGRGSGGMRLLNKRQTERVCRPSTRARMWTELCTKNGFLR